MTQRGMRLTMNACMRFGGVLALLWSWGVQAAPVVVDSAPTAVTVLPQGAWVTRQFTLNLPATGSESIEIGQLPTSLDRVSVQITSDQADLTAPVQWVPEPADQSPAWVSLTQRQVALKQRADKADDALAADRVRLLVFQAQMESADRLGGHKPAAPAAFLTDASAKAKFDRLLGELITNQRAAKNELDNIAEARRVLQKEFAALNNRPAMQAAVLQISRRHAGSTPVQVILRYLVANAQWQPVYRANFSLSPLTDLAKNQTEQATPALGGAQIHWSMVAEVSQQTGEDWTNLPLTLALQDTRRYVPAPKFARWRIGFTPPAVAPRPMMAAAESRLMSAPANDSLMALENGSGFQAQFHSHQPVTVLSQSEQSAGTVTIPLFKQTVAATPELLIAPPTQTQAVLTARFTPETTEALPPGQWQLFVEGDQVAQIHRPVLMPKEKIRLSFGMDPKVQVKYTAAPSQREENGLIGKSTQIQRSFTVDLTSLHERTVPVTVLLQLPVAEDAEISVEPLTETTTPSSKQYDGVEGLWAWSSQLKSKQQLAIQFGYRLRWPSDKTVYGLR